MTEGKKIFIFGDDKDENKNFFITVGNSSELHITCNDLKKLIEAYRILLSTQKNYINMIINLSKIIKKINAIEPLYETIINEPLKLPIQFSSAGSYAKNILMKKTILKMRMNQFKRTKVTAKNLQDKLLELQKYYDTVEEEKKKISNINNVKKDETDLKISKIGVIMNEDNTNVYYQLYYETDKSIKLNQVYIVSDLTRNFDSSCLLIHSISEKEKKEQDRLEKERLEKERNEKERNEKERLEKERNEKERNEKERLEKESNEQEGKKKQQQADKLKHAIELLRNNQELLTTQLFSKTSNKDEIKANIRSIKATIKSTKSDIEGLITEIAK